MQIKTTTEITKDLDNFQNKEWTTTDKEHYGKTITWQSWTPKIFHVYAEEKMKF